MTTWHNMDPIKVPEKVSAARTTFEKINVGPPHDFDGECATVEALVGAANGMYVYYDYWKPTPEQLEVLNNGGFIELAQYTSQMVMHSMTIWSGEEDDD